MNQLVREVMIETVRQARQLSGIVKGVAHSGLRGQFRESFLARALQPWLPRGIELGTGVIVDEHGTSRQVNEDDIVIYAPDLLPAVLPLAERNIFFLDAVVARVEVKSTLSSNELRAAVEGAIAVKRLHSSFSGKREIHAVFAYKSTASVRSELARLKEQAASLGWVDDIPPISLICVDEKECYMHGRVAPPRQYDTAEEYWYDMAPEAPDESTLAFICCLASSVIQIRDGRQHVQIARFARDTSKVQRVD